MIIHWSTAQEVLCSLVREHQQSLAKCTCLAWMLQRLSSTCHLPYELH